MARTPGGDLQGLHSERTAADELREETRPLRISCWFLAALLLAAVAPLRAAVDVRAAGAQWPSLDDQLQAGGVRPGTALEALIAANQDFSLLRPDERQDSIPIPLWLRVHWRRAHPEGTYTALDRAGGYPFVLEEAWEWLRTHQDLMRGPGAEAPEVKRDTVDAKSATVTGEQRISGLQTTPRSESDIRVDYWDPQKIMGASNDLSAAGNQAQFFSTNGGATWGQSSLPLQLADAFHSDPTVEWTSDGTAWSATIGIDALVTALHLRAYKSVDNGATWTFDGTFDGGQSATDKEIMWADHSATSPFKDNIYVCWRNNTQGYVNRRTGPAGSWQTPIQTTGTESIGDPIGCDLKTNAFGDVFDFWPAAGNRRIVVAKSTNGGVSYGAGVVAATTFDGLDIGVPAMASRRALIYVAGGAYRTVLKDLVYASWTDLSGEAGCTSPANEPGTDVASTCKTRVWFARSSNGGTTWSGPVMLNNQGSLNDQFNQWLVVDEVTGALSIVYYDTVGDPGRKKTDVWYQSSFDDGVTWHPAVKVTSAQTDETTGGQDNANQYGDYNGLSGYAGVFFPSWTDRRNNAREEIWTAKVNDPACTPPGAPAIGTATATLPNQIQVTWGNGSPAATSFEIQRVIGTCATPDPFGTIAAGVPSSPYADNTVSGGSHYAYKVAGVDSTGLCRSVPSACAEATATGACTLPPTFGGLASATNNSTFGCGITLAWAAATPACGGPVTYNVYRSTSPGFVPGVGNRIATGIGGTGYVDTGELANGTSYVYVVRAVDGSNGAEETNVVTKSAAPTGPVASGSTLVETFEGAGGFDNPGWTHAALLGAADWALSTIQSQTPTHSWLSDEQSTVSDRVLVSPAFVPGASSTLSFWHAFAFEGTVAQCYDSGTLEVSTDGGSNWAVMPDASFTGGGFNGTTNGVFSNPLAGKRAWCGNPMGAMSHVTANLASLMPATAVELRWHEGDDFSGAATEPNGWFVDSVTIANVGTYGVCVTSGLFASGFEEGVLPGTWSGKTP